MPRSTTDKSEATTSATHSPPVQDRSYLAYLRPTPRPFLNLASGHFPPGTRTEPHAHPCLAIHGCLKGPLTLQLAEQQVVLDAGVFYLIPAGVTHRWHNQGTATAATISFLIDTEHPGRWPAGVAVEATCRALSEQVTTARRFSTSGDQDLHRIFWFTADQLTAETPREELALVGTLLAWLGQIKSRLSHSDAIHSDDTAVQIRRLLLTRVRDRLSLSQIAREVRTSTTTAKERFREAFGCGIMAYFNQLKIWQAKRMLSDFSLNVEQISHQLGFSSPSYFSRAFLKHVGVTPTTYRQQQARPAE